MSSGHSYCQKRCNLPSAILNRFLFLTHPIISLDYLPYGPSISLFPALHFVCLFPPPLPNNNLSNFSISHSFFSTLSSQSSSSIHPALIPDLSSSTSTTVSTYIDTLNDLLFPSMSHLSSLISHSHIIILFFVHAHTRSIFHIPSSSSFKPSVLPNLLNTIYPSPLLPRLSQKSQILTLLLHFSPPFPCQPSRCIACLTRLFGCVIVTRQKQQS